MNRSRFFISVNLIRQCVVLLVCCFAASVASAADLRILFLGDQKSHKPATRFEILKPVMSAKGIALTYTEDVTSLNLETLNQYDGLVVYANIDEIVPDQAKALLDYVASGKGFIPIHCATYCFRNAPEVVALMGAQFQRHGGSEMTTQSAGVDHPLMKGYQTFTSWDETYVHHKHNENNRTVLEYRTGDFQAPGNHREPWTWIRTHGKGRVFYTAWGHDERTWNQVGFHDLIERGIRWACGEGETAMASSTASSALPPLKKLPNNLKPFEFVDVGPEIPNYAAGRGEILNLMQQPIPAVESMKHIATPEGFHVELFADESMLDGKMLQGKPLAMTWDDQGRLWICESLDYPNELNESRRGRDHIRIVADNDGDGRADTSTIFAENLSIPTAIAFHRGGAVVQNATETLYLKDTDGDGKADIREVLISDWTVVDTHGGVSNFRNGLDNWIWAMQGYNNSAPVIDGVRQQSFRMGFFRFKLSQDDIPKVEKLEFLRSTTNNTWGLGISEEGLIFGSTANRQPSFFMPIPNRYYERVNGWAPETLEMICPDHLFHPITDKIRQVDHHGGYTAAAGHALYTARNYPEAWWNRTAFVCGPTGKLVGTFVIERDGASMKSHVETNLLASDDEWTAPIMAEVGPDGNVWVLDWYNYIVQHNPTPQGFETGKGHAYETKLRDKKYGRIYRIVHDTSPTVSGPALAADSSIPRPSTPSLQSRSPADRVTQLKNPTMQVRLTAQRLLVERGNIEIVPQLIALVQNESVDAIGLNVGAIHALHTLSGLGQLKSGNAEALQAAIKALKHPSAGVRLNAVRVLPNTASTFEAIRHANSIADTDYQIVLATLLKISDMETVGAGPVLSKAIRSPMIASDRWLNDAITSAGAMHAESFLTSILDSDRPLSPLSSSAVVRIAEHLARKKSSPKVIASLLAAMGKQPNKANDAIIEGWSKGWPKDYVIKLDASTNKTLRSLFASVSGPSQAMLARLASSWSNDSLEKEIAPIIDGFVKSAANVALPIPERLKAAAQLIQLDPGRKDSIDALQLLIGPQSPSSLSVGLIQTISKSKADGLIKYLLRINAAATPELRQAVIREMLSRPELTKALLTAMEGGEMSITDLSTEQRGIVSTHPSKEIREVANRLLRAGGVVIDNDRAKLVTAKLSLMNQTGDPDIGKAIFTKHCATCHVFKGEGNIVGPNLNGMSVHPKVELLTHILDPNRSVEANYRLYTVLTTDGVIVSGLLSAESLTSIEMVDAQGKRHTILREDIEELRPSAKSAMPEGFEQSIDDAALINLLEYVTQKEPFISLGLESVANVITTQGMFQNRDNARERLVFSDWGVQTFEGIPFTLIDPRGTSVKNAVMLYGPTGTFAPQMPKSVAVRCRTSAKAIHLLGGVAGWASKKPASGGVSMIVRLKYADGQTEDHPLIDGQHIADYIGKFDVPKSKFAFAMQDGGQLRTLQLKPKREVVIDAIELVKPDHKTAPVVMAITIEPGGSH
ncbi:MAG: PVC-type heme-binding CxxCH protein [Pirellulaceae bacterium]|nr:PVC-type heme-binding CxxCH protein [Pirellulaceae bacterium]